MTHATVSFMKESAAPVAGLRSALPGDSRRRVRASIHARSVSVLCPSAQPSALFRLFNKNPLIELVFLVGRLFASWSSCSREWFGASIHPLGFERPMRTIWTRLGT